MHAPMPAAPIAQRVTMCDLSMRLLLRLRCHCCCRNAEVDSNLSRRQQSDDQDFVEKGLRSTASMFASIPASGARMQAYGDNQPSREFAHIPTHAQTNGRASIKVLSSTSSENAGGMRAAITNKLGSTLSMLSSVQSGGLPVRGEEGRG